MAGWTADVADWVIRFNEQGRRSHQHPFAGGRQARTAQSLSPPVVEEADPAIHGVVRWRACDLIMRLHEEFGLSVSDDTIYRALKDLGFSHVSARPKAYKQDADAMAAFKKTLPYAWRKSARAHAGHHRSLVPGEMRSVRRTSSPIAGQEGRVPGHQINALNQPICSGGMPNRNRRCPRSPVATPKPCNFISRIAQVPRRTRISSRSSLTAQRPKVQPSLAAATACARAQSPRKHLAVMRTGCRTDLQILRRHRRHCCYPGTPHRSP